jgi:uncharacterized coiled-coil protein SlyX
MPDDRLNTVAQIQQLHSELRKAIKKFARVAESALATTTYDVDRLAKHQQQIETIQDQLDDLIDSLLPEERRSTSRGPRRKDSADARQG